MPYGTTEQRAAHAEFRSTGRGAARQTAPPDCTTSSAFNNVSDAESDESGSSGDESGAPWDESGLSRDESGAQWADYVRSGKRIPSSSRPFQRACLLSTHIANRTR